MAKLGGVFINTVYEENPDRNVTFSDHPIEDGGNITDHGKSEPLTMSIRGVISGPDAAARKRKLEAFMKKKTPLKYVYRNVFNNMVIESFPTTHNAQIKNGFSFSMKLKQISIAQKAKTVKAPIIKSVVNKGQQQQKGTTPKKVYKVKKGDTVKDVSKKTGQDEKKIVAKVGMASGKPNIYPGQVYM